MTIDWWTLALEAINFGILAWLLHRFLFRPVLALIERRRRADEATRAATEAARRAAEAEAAAWRQRAAGLEDERQDLIREARARIEDERARMLEEARGEAARLLEAGRSVLEGERAAALASLREEVGGLGVDLAARLLDRSAGPGMAEMFLERLEDRLDGLAVGPGKIVEVATAPALDADARRSWGERLGRRLGPDVALSFVAAPELIAGVRLDLPGTTLELSWRAALEEAKRELTRDEPPA